MVFKNIVHEVFCITYVYGHDEHEKMTIKTKLILGGTIAERWQPETVILAADNDGKSDTIKSVEKLEKNLKSYGINLDIRRPLLLDSYDKTDWNDILVYCGQKDLNSKFNKV